MEYLRVGIEYFRLIAPQFIMKKEKLITEKKIITWQRRISLMIMEKTFVQLD